MNLYRLGIPWAAAVPFRVGEYCTPFDIDEWPVLVRNSDAQALKASVVFITHLCRTRASHTRCLLKKGRIVCPVEGCLFVGTVTYMMPV
jgi:hypothetical protein